MATKKRKAAAKRVKAKKVVRKAARRTVRKAARRAAPKAAAKTRKAARKKPAAKKARVPKAAVRALVAALVGEGAEAPPAADHEVSPGELEFEDDVLAEAKEVFQHYDRDGSGTIERGEFGRLLDALGAELTEQELAAGLAEVDRDHSGRVSWGEFSAWWRSR